MKSPLLVLGALSLFAPAFAQGTAPKSNAQASFEALKGLAGTWSGVVTTDPPNPEINGPIQVTMRVGSRGSLLIHEMAPGGMTEPTMIYLDGNRLTLVHYCEAGNRPRLVAGRSADPKTADFDFAEISGSKQPTYVSHLTFTLADSSHHTEDWTFTMPDSSRLHAHFDLKRAAK